MDLAAMREQYGLAGLDEADLAPDPMAQFTDWFDDPAVSTGAGLNICIRIITSRKIESTCTMGT